ncbi:hypothetical protein P3T76_006825 [Phytophthora citrophthora]|uniref:Uncharacterized protein n=1 Tax=Phytophthora citrophthora TaxID=4793 RepID=A0AAD9GPM5_9STRA|nr:hypothetical protein P3T76_006825 [Phytophthora citrophthora]
MEVVALNERLRSDFSPLLKLLPPPYAASAFATLKNSTSTAKDPKVASSNDRYTQHCRYMLWRLNSYQYGSSGAFLLDLEQLERVAETTETKQLVKSLVTAEGKKQEQEGVVKVVKKPGALDCGIPGLQETTTTDHSKDETENNMTWRCNLSVGGQIVTIGSFKTREGAEGGYEEQRKKMAENAAGFNKLKQLAAKRDEEQRQEDKRVLKEALAQCHPRLTTMKMSSVLPAPVANAARGIPRSLVKSIAASSSPAASPATSEAGASPLKMPRTSKKQKPDAPGPSSLKKQKIDTAAANSSAATNRSYLTLRRVIQTRLCRHLKGQQVCVLADPNNRENVRWKASGRLEAGKVYHLGKKKQMSFADFVRDKLGHPMSACEHMFLVETRESIDDHLKVCDAFSDKERELGYPQLMKSKKARRR